jgi:hypothetical protein
MNKLETILYCCVLALMGLTVLYLVLNMGTP